MGRIVLCGNKIAKNPFYVRCMEKNVSTMEELCFFLYHEVYFVEEFHDWAELAGWLRREMGMEALAKELQRLVVGYNTRIRMGKAILKAVGYRSEEELLAYERKLEEIHRSTGLVRAKKRADYLAENRKYAQALELYGSILESPDQPDDKLLADVNHNMGVVFGRLFYFDKAAACFRQSFTLEPSMESLKQYKLALRLAEKEDGEDSMMDLPSVKQLDEVLDRELSEISQETDSAEDEMHRLTELKRKGRVSEYYEALEQLLSRWKEECRGTGP